MRNKKGTLGTLIGLLILTVIIIILSGLVVYGDIKYQLIQDEFKDFIKFQIELTQYTIEEECDLNFNETIDNFLKYKTNQILNNASSDVREVYE